MKKKIKEFIRKIKLKRVKFSCIPYNCVVSIACSSPCDKLEFDEGKLKDFVLEYHCCPDCGGKTFLEGHCGGLSQNIQCYSCKHEFNVALPFVFERIGTFTKGMIK